MFVSPYPSRIRYRHEVPVAPRFGFLTPEGDRLVTGDIAGQVQVWEPQTGTLLTTSQLDPHPLGELALSPDGSFGLYNTNQGMIAVCEWKDGPGSVLWRHQTPEAAREGEPWWCAMAWSPDGAFVVSNCTEDPRVVQLFEAHTGVLRTQWLADDIGLGHPRPPETSKGPRANFLDGSLFWSPDGRSLVFGQGGTVYARDPWTGSLQQQYLLFPFVSRHTVNQMAWSPDGRWLAVHDPWAVQVFACATGELVMAFGQTPGPLSRPAHPQNPATYSTVRTLRWLADGTSLVVAWGEVIQIREATTGALLAWCRDPLRQDGLLSTVVAVDWPVAMDWFVTVIVAERSLRPGQIYAWEPAWEEREAKAAPRT